MICEGGIHLSTKSTMRNLNSLSEHNVAHYLFSPSYDSSLWNTLSTVTGEVCLCHSCIWILKFQASNSFNRDAGHRRRIDVGRVQLSDDKVDRYFMNVASLHL